MLKKSEELTVNDIIKTKELTDKAEFLYKNGFFNEPQRVEKIDDSYVDVTYKDGFKGLIVLENGSKLFVAKAEAEEENVYSYQLFELTDVSESQYTKLQEIAQSEKFNFVKIIGYVGLGLSTIALLFFVILLATLIIGGAAFDDIVLAVMTALPPVLTSALLSALILKKNK